jgi:hypothetical protein
MRIWKPVFRGRDGKTKQLGKWWIELRDHHQVVRRFPGFKDKTQSRLLGDQIERLVASRVAGQPPSPELTRWLEHVPPKLRDRLVKIGLLDNTRAAASKPLSKHLNDFAASLPAKGNTAQYVTQTESRAKAVFEGCGFHTWSDMRAECIEHYLANLRVGGLSVQSSNYYLQTCKQFCRWMLLNRRVSESPVAHLKLLNARTDRRCERALLYRIAVETGLRVNELHSLTVGSFDLVPHFTSSTTM